MIKIIVAYDEQDSAIGYYCLECKNDLAALIDENANFLTVDYINSRICNHAYITIKLENIDFDNFIFVAYSHGEKSGKSLLCNGSAYLDASNVHLFKNSLVYSMACATGKRLGHDLINQGCLAFIGFNDVVEVVQEYSDIIRRCENWALIMFLLKDIALVAAFDDMKREFTRQIDILEESDFGSSSWLIGNRDALVLLGNENLTRRDFWEYKKN